MNNEMWSEFHRIMDIQRESPPQPEAKIVEEIPWSVAEQQFSDALVVEFRPSLFLEEVRRIKRERELIAEGVKLCVVGYVPPDDYPVSPFAQQFIQFLKEQ